MVIKFSDEYLENLAKDKPVKGKPRFDKQVITKFKKTLKILQRSPDSHSLRAFASLNFESLKGDRKGYYSVRVDYHFRLIFTIEKDVVQVSEVITVEELTNHYQ